MRMLDALVLGKGPAGLAAAAALAERGLAVAIAGPPGPVRWRARYAAWRDELPADLGDVLYARWPRAVVVGNARHVASREYALLDNDALADTLIARCDGKGVEWMDGIAAGADHDANGTRIRFDGGSTAIARVVVDATGAGTRLVHRAAQPEPGIQSAIGWTVEADRVPLAPREAVLMDWGREWRDGDAAPSFLYAFALPDGRWFLEETALVRRPAVGEDLLERRLGRRIEEMGISVRKVTDRERVWIPMGGALPPPQRIVGFGAAGGMIHPATGYSVAHALRTAPVLATAAAQALGEGRSPAEAAARAWDAIWPAEARRRWALYRFGMEAVAGMEGAETRAFFDAFFTLPEADWSEYLSARLPAVRMLAAMGRIYRAAPPAVRRRLRGGVTGREGRELAAGVLSSLAGRTRRTE